VTVFATVIAITKDLPDVEGDQAHNIQTFATRMGVPAVSNLGERRRGAAGPQPRAGAPRPWVRRPGAGAGFTAHLRPPRALA
jgi:hypothetical protein